MQKLKKCGIAGVVALLLCSYFGTYFMCVATMNYFLILTGFLMRKTNRLWHVSLVSLGMFFDLVLVLTLQIQRDAVATAISFKLSPLNQAHIFCSTIATALYIPMVITGIMLLRHKNCKVWHQRLGFSVIFFRSLGFVLMFSMLKSLKNL